MISILSLVIFLPIRADQVFEMLTVPLNIRNVERFSNDVETVDLVEDFELD